MILLRKSPIPPDNKPINRHHSFYTGMNGTADQTTPKRSRILPNGRKFFGVKLKTTQRVDPHPLSRHLRGGLSQGEGKESRVGIAKRFPPQDLSKKTSKGWGSTGRPSPAKKHPKGQTLTPCPAICGAGSPKERGKESRVGIAKRFPPQDLRKTINPDSRPYK